MEVPLVVFAVDVVEVENIFIVGMGCVPLPDLVVATVPFDELHLRELLTLLPLDGERDLGPEMTSHKVQMSFHGGGGGGGGFEV